MMMMIPAVIVLTSNHDRADCRTGVVAAHRSCRRPCHRPTLFKVRYDTIRYDTIRDAILTCARKPT